MLNVRVVIDKPSHVAYHSCTPHIAGVILSIYKKEGLILSNKFSNSHTLSSSDLAFFSLTGTTVGNLRPSPSISKLTTTVAVIALKIHSHHRRRQI